MRSFVICFLYLSSACSNLSFQGIGSSAKSPEAKKSAQVHNSEDAEPDTLKDQLNQSLAYIESTHGDNEFTFQQYTFANLEWILKDLIDATESLPEIDEADQDISEEMDPVLYEQFMEAISEYSLDYNGISTSIETSSAFQLVLQQKGSWDDMMAVKNHIATKGPNGAALSAAMGGGAVVARRQLGDRTGWGDIFDTMIVLPPPAPVVTPDPNVFPDTDSPFAG